MMQPTIEQMIRLALGHHQAGRLSDAEASFRQVLKQTLDDSVAADCHQHLAFVLEDAGRGDDAVGEYQAAARLNPDDPIIASNLAAALIRTGRYEEAERTSRQAIARHPESPDCHNQLGSALVEQGKPNEALAHYRRAIALRPDDAELHYNVGVALMDLRQFDDAIAALKSAIALRPDFAEAHAKLGIALLTIGDFARGWPEYEWRQRWTRPNQPPATWDGSDLRGRSIVLEAEQGIGDTIQLVRYAAMVEQRGGRVIIAAPRPLHCLLARARGVSEVIDTGNIPPDALRFPLMSLPRVFGTTLETIPASAPYIDPDPQLVAAWRSQFAADSPMKVGIAWAGNAAQRDDRWRSCRLRDLAPLAHVSGVKLYSLQVGGPARQIRDCGFDVVDLSPQLTDLAETAAAMANLDLIITVDSAVAHLAGAVAAPVWTLLFATSDWRWLVDREDNPWYPTMRVFRQRDRGHWDDVVDRAAAELRRWQATR